MITGVAELYSLSYQQYKEYNAPLNASIAEKNTSVVYSDEHADCNYYYFPADSKKTLVFLHGGAWQSNTATECLFLQEQFTEYNTVFASYAKIQDVGLAGCVNSVLSLIDHLTDTKDIDKLYLIGHSSGGHLALYASTQREVHGVCGISAVINPYTSPARNFETDEVLLKYYPGNYTTTAKQILLLRGDREHLFKQTHIALLNDWQSANIEYKILRDVDHFTSINDSISHIHKFIA